MGLIKFAEMIFIANPLPNFFSNKGGGCYNCSIVLKLLTFAITFWKARLLAELEYGVMVHVVEVVCEGWYTHMLKWCVRGGTHIC